jgi:F-type H+-transporting ATPase subunit a
VLTGIRAFSYVNLLPAYFSLSRFMTRVRILGLFLSAFAIASPAWAAEAHGVEPMASPLFNLGPLPVTNSMLMTWVVALVLIVAVRVLVGKPKLVPSHGQAVIESLLTGIKDIVDPIVGPRAIKATFPLLIALFVYILIENWSGLFPGVGTIMMRSHADGSWMELVRPAHADMNGTIALSFAAFVAGFIIVLRFAGPKLILIDLFGNKADKNDVPAIVYYPLSLVFIAVGVLELVSIFFARPVSLSFRLYGNIFGGENLMHSMSAISRWGLPVPFYFMELLVGLVQAFVFTLLIAVYIGLLTNHGDEHSHEAAAGHDSHGKSPASH